MKCQFCNGLGYVFENDFNGQFDMICPKCKGKKEVDENGKPILTNEEWFCGLSTDKKADFLNSIICACYKCGDGGLIDEKCPFGECECNVAEWLKQAHTTIKE